MSQGDKKLVLQDLCARLPYGVKVVDLDGWQFTVKGIDGDSLLVDKYSRFGNTYNTVGYGWKPYLRPLSAMTEEEEREINSLLGEIYDFSFRMDELLEEIVMQKTVPCAFIDWLNRKMFDYRGLIPMGVALEAPKGMYSTKK